jgi:anti-anti-sigma factor
MKKLEIRDELTIFTAAEQKNKFLGFLNADDELEINLAHVEEIDTAGLQLLILVKQEAARTGKVLRFVMHSKAVLDILELSNLTTLFGDQIVLAHN